MTWNVNPRASNIAILFCFNYCSVLIDDFIKINDQACFIGPLGENSLVKEGPEVL